MTKDLLEKLLESGVKMNYFDFSNNTGTINIRIGSEGIHASHHVNAAKKAPETIVKKQEPKQTLALPRVNTTIDEDEEVVEEEEIEEEIQENIDDKENQQADDETDNNKVTLDLSDNLLEFINNDNYGFTADATLIKKFLVVMHGQLNADSDFKGKKTTVKVKEFNQLIANSSGAFDKSKFNKDDFEDQ